MVRQHCRPAQSTRFAGRSTIADPSHLLDAADHPASEECPGAPRQVNLRRAVSTVYCALFHWLARCAADSLVGWVRPRPGAGCASTGRSTTAICAYGVGKPGETETCSDHFGSRPADVRLEPGTDFLYGDDLVDMMVKEELLIDTIFWYRQPEETEPALADG